MAGIAGTYGSNLSVNREQTVSDMLRAVFHRGPDGLFLVNEGKYILGCCKLDTSARRGQAHTGGNKRGIVFDGLLFNEGNTRSTDAEVLSQLYETYENDCFSYIDGSFAIAVADDNELLLARDHVGARSLFYGRKNETIYFASELKALIPLVDNACELPPGKVFSSQTGIRNFSMYTPDIPSCESTKKAQEKVKELLYDATFRRMNDHAVGGVALSGGLDSSIIAAIALEIDPQVNLFTIGLKDSPDMEMARIVAKHLGAQHRHLFFEFKEEEIESIVRNAVWYLESFEEDCISGCIANMFASRLAGGFTNCCLCGEGSDELFGGYHLLKDIKDIKERQKMMDKLVNIAYNTGLRRLDRGWLCNSVDYRTPFLDSYIIAFSKSIPIEWKIHGTEQTEKWILREAFRDRLPQVIIDRKKLRFAGGSSVDDSMDAIASKYVSKEEFKKNNTTVTGYNLNSPKELWYYKIFKEFFPADNYEKQVVRWDPFK